MRSGARGMRNESSISIDFSERCRIFKYQACFLTKYIHLIVHSPKCPQSARALTLGASKRAKGGAATESTSFQRWLADADAPHATLAYLEMEDLCDFRATCRAAKAVVSTYEGRFKEFDCDLATGDDRPLTLPDGASASPG